MALVLKDRVKQTTTTTGTGTITLSGTVTGFSDFSVIGDGNTTYYAIVNTAAGEWEVGYGTYTASGTTLTRTTVLESSNSGSLVNFSAGAKDVFVTYPAEKAVAQDNSGNVVISGSFTGPLTGNASTATQLATARSIGLTGDVSGSANFDGSANISITATVADDSHNHIIGNVDGLQTALDAKAPLASPALTGTPTAPTAVAGTNTTQVATTSFVSTAVANLVDSAPATLDTLNELAAALGDDPNFATTVSTSLGTKAPLASPALTGTPTAPTAAVGTNTTQVATTAFVNAEIANDAPTKTGTGASGTWGISVTGNAATATSAGNADTTDGYHVSLTADAANTIPVRNSQGYLELGWINTISGDNGTTTLNRIYASNDGYIRYYTPTNFRTVLDVPTRGGSGASGTWGINVTGSSGSCTGNAATATLATKASTLAQSGGNGTGMTFNWSGQSGQPAWLWGSNDGTNIYVWNPSNFNVNYASSAGNASTATTLLNFRTINGTSFNGSANITTSNWGTARTLTIGNTGKSVNGSGNVSWSLSEIGAAAVYASGCVYENSKTITANYTMTSGKNGMSAGPITINSGITVTIPSGSAWTVV